MLPKFVLIPLLLYLLVVTDLNSQASVPLDGVLDDLLLYKRGYACALSPLKSTSVFLLADENGTGYLADFGDLGREHPNGVPVKLLANGAPDDWIATMKNFDLNSHKAWTKLNLKMATEIWGAPRKHLKRNFYSFDAHGTCNQEENIYHIDFRFDRFDQVLGYRVRGIGICNAKWIIKLDENRITMTN